MYIFSKKETITKIGEVHVLLLHCLSLFSITTREKQSQILKTYMSTIYISMHFTLFLTFCTDTLKNRNIRKTGQTLHLSSPNQDSKDEKVNSSNRDCVVGIT